MMKEFKVADNRTMQWKKKKNTVGQGDKSQC